MNNTIDILSLLTFFLNFIGIILSFYNYDIISKTFLITAIFLYIIMLYNIKLFKNNQRNQKIKAINYIENIMSNNSSSLSDYNIQPII